MNEILKPIFYQEDNAAHFGLSVNKSLRYHNYYGDFLSVFIYKRTKSELFIAIHDTPEAVDISARILHLSSYPDLQRKKVLEICSIIKKAIR